MAANVAARTISFNGPGRGPGYPAVNTILWRRQGSRRQAGNGCSAIQGRGRNWSAYHGVHNQRAQRRHDGSYRQCHNEGAGCIYDEPCHNRRNRPANVAAEVLDAGN